MKAINKATKVQRGVHRLMVEKRYAGGMTSGLAKYFKRRSAKAERKAAKEILKDPELL